MKIKTSELTGQAPKTQGIGWFVSASTGSSDGDWQIQKADHPEVDGEEALPAFETDDEAIKHVIAQAKAGDEKAIDALWQVLDHDGLVNRILWCQAMGWTHPRAAAYADQED